jgi:hypothetical protein
MVVTGSDRSGGTNITKVLRRGFLRLDKDWWFAGRIWRTTMADFSPAQAGNG